MAIADVSYDLNAGKSANVDAAVAAATGLKLVGFAARSSGAAVFSIVHGATGAGGDAIIPVEFTAQCSTLAAWFGDEGIPVPNGLSLLRTSGTFDCTLFYKTLP